MSGRFSSGVRIVGPCDRKDGPPDIRLTYETLLYSLRYTMLSLESGFWKMLQANFFWMGNRERYNMFPLRCTLVHITIAVIPPD